MEKQRRLLSGPQEQYMYVSFMQMAEFNGGAVIAARNSIGGLVDVLALQGT
jgi:hypothetical protein